MILSFIAGVFVTIIVAALVISNNKKKFIAYLTDIDVDAIVEKAGNDAKAIADEIKSKIKAKIEELKE
ncbi:MAG: hypothetical protein WC169_11035 [Dehalococcoidia bacterium]|jgi:hypothetical protein